MRIFDPERTLGPIAGQIRLDIPAFAGAPRMRSLPLMERCMRFGFLRASGPLIQLLVL